MGGKGGMYDTQMHVKDLKQMQGKFNELASLAQSPIAEGKEIFVHYSLELQEIINEISALGELVRSVEGLNEQLVGLGNLLAAHIRFGKELYYKAPGYEAHQMTELAATLYAMAGVVEPIDVLLETLEEIKSRHLEFAKITQNPEAYLVHTLLKEQELTLTMIRDTFSNSDQGSRTPDPKEMAGLLSGRMAEVRELHQALGM